IYGNSAARTGGVLFRNNPNWEGTGATFTMKGGRIQGGADSDGFAKNSGHDAAVGVPRSDMAKWGAGGAYTKGGVSQSGGGNIGSTSDTLIAKSK
ncbi:MAG: hypothetical protein LBC60_11565, partial [Spirochaetaceae bacterium]|nr:hypothetical protein [Spirochaetaceae bacterium]